MHKAGKLAALTLALIMLVIPIGMAQKCGGKEDAKPESEPTATSPVAEETTPAAATTAPESQPAKDNAAEEDMGEANAEDAGEDVDAGEKHERIYMPATKAGPFIKLEDRPSRQPNAAPKPNKK